VIKLRIVESDEQKKMVNSLIERHHSYVPTTDSVGRRIDWLIYDVRNEDIWPHDEDLLGMIGIGSSVYPPPKDILTYVGLTKEQYRNVFNSFSNNWRFCMQVKGVKNAGTQILKQFRQQAVIEWKKKYGDELVYIVTFVGASHNGAVYKADNWAQIGTTAGLPPHDSSSMKWHDKEELKQKFVKPTGENKKIIFIKKVGKNLPIPKPITEKTEITLDNFP